MTRFLSAVLLVALGAGGLTSTARAEGDARTEVPGDSLTVFVTGYSLGSLRPCGCSGGQLGGLERRAALLQGVPQSRRMVLDTGHWVKQDGEQDAIKARILARAFQMLGYDVVRLADQDLRLAQNLGLLGEMVAAGGVITQEGTGADANVPQATEKAFAINGRRISVRVTAADYQTLGVRFQGQGPADSNEADGVDILIVDKLDASVADIQRGPGARPACVIGPADSDEPRLWSDPHANPLVFSMGRYGRHVARLQISLDAPRTRPRLQFAVLTVSEDLPNQADLAALYKDYQQIVADSGLLDRHPKVPLPKDLEYVGSKACWRCHQYEVGMAATQKHAQAYATLEKAGSHRDPECVVCHVVGLDYESGFVSVQETPQLTDVGCEVCHGPGSEHVRTEGKARTCLPKRTCLDCHTPEHSRDYAGHEQEFLEKIRHWKELRKASGVKP